VTAGEAVLRVSGLSVSLPSEAGTVQAVRDASFDLLRGRVLGIVGESGSGKSMTAKAIMGLLPDSAQVSGSIRLEDRELLGLGDREMSSVRGNRISLVSQDPLSALTPVLTIGSQLSEALRIHRRTPKSRIPQRVLDLLELVRIPDPPRVVNSFPHELSGGMRQRVLIAMAIANDPDVIVADEPTTALDVTVQAQILDVFRTVRDATGAAMILVTHDLGVVAGIADDVLVMRSGELVEAGGVDDVFHAPRQAYTRELLAAVPRIDSPGRVVGTPTSDSVSRPLALRADNLRRHYTRRHTRVSLRRRTDVVRAVDGVTFEISEGETFALVGESGSGKSTTVREVMQLAAPSSGRLELLGQDVSTLSAGERNAMRSRIQIVFQDPLASLDPRLPVSDILGEPLQTAGWSRAQVAARVRELLAIVGLSPQDHLERFPGEFSGGQRQRIAIARALALEPSLLVLDEPVSALDVTVQAGILNLLDDLQSRLGIAYLFVSHDLAVVRSIAHRVGVMYHGRLVEQGGADAVFTSPVHPYTRALLAAAPVPDPRIERHRSRAALAARLEHDPGPECAFFEDPAFGECGADPRGHRVGPDQYVACVRGADLPIFRH
jgi:peptide/nickel transport system ATP-binding protein